MDYLENFYKGIKDKMSNPPEVPTDFQMWEDIEQNLDKKKRNWMLPVFLGLPFIILFSGFIGYLLAPKTNTTLGFETEHTRDTIYINNTTHSIDTIIKTEFITQWKYRNSNQTIQLQSQIQNLSNLNRSLQNDLASLDSKLEDYRMAFSESIIKDNPKYKHLDYFRNINVTSPYNDNLLSTGRSTFENIALSPLLNPGMLEYTRPKIMIIHNDLWLENMLKNKKPKSLLEQIVPDYVNLGISVETPGIAFTKDLSPGLESGFGFQSEFLFSPKFSIVTGIRSRSTQNKTTDIAIASTYPQPIVTSEETFKNLKVKSTFVDIPFTFKYQMFKHKQNDIYLTGGVLLSKRTQTEYIFEYIRDASEIYYEEKAPGGNWGIGSTIIGLGYEMDTWGNTSAFLESYARYKFNGDSEPIHGLGFRFGMYYKI